ncbi:MAG: 16S rRNA (cytidine(1402)-2'-O)-methyltransferase [Marinilabiliaceae bacterium]|nr:16S rRNA (cytidine(1402)-2'-O)-methyltransferase [Marinilabiliaceae bacterium]
MGKLYLVPTPIGNLEDMTLRAIKTLKEVDLILAEDTRTSSKLLNHFNIETKMVSHHKFNEHATLDKTIMRLKSGENLAVITDAGTPGISDPGFLLVRECKEHNIDVECLPGATAFVPALVTSGLSSDRFLFEGFLPHKKGRQTRLLQLKDEDKTIILYESPHRLIKTLKQLAEFFGETRKAAVSREISKLHEENKTATLSELIQYFEAKPVKGEIVIIIDGFNKKLNDN